MQGLSIKLLRYVSALAFLLVGVSGGIGYAQQPGQSLGTLAGQVNLEKVTGFVIDTSVPAIDFTVVIRNGLRQTVFLREVKASSVQLQRRDAQPILVGTGTGTTIGTIQPVAGFPAVAGIELPPGISTNTFRISLPSDAARMGANLIEIFNVLNAGTGRRDVVMLFALSAKGGVRDPHGVEWVNTEQQKRFSSSFDDLVSFASLGDGGDIGLAPAGTISIRRIGSAQVVTQNQRRFLDMQIEVNNTGRQPMVLRDPKFSQTAFFLDGKTHIPIALGNGSTTQTVEHTPGFPPENGMLMPPGTSSHPIRFPMATDDAAALRNLVDIMNVIGSPAQRGGASMIFEISARAGIKTPSGLEGVKNIEAQKNFPTIIKGEYLFE